MKKQHSLLLSFADAWAGVITALKRERNLKIHSLVLIAVVGAGIFLRLRVMEWLLVILAATMVIGFELMNTAIECLVDLIEPNENPLAAEVKEIAAGAVLIASVAAAIIGFSIFFPRVRALF